MPNKNITFRVSQLFGNDTQQHQQPSRLSKRDWVGTSGRIKSRTNPEEYLSSEIENQKRLLKDYPEQLKHLERLESSLKLTPKYLERKAGE